MRPLHWDFAPCAPVRRFFCSLLWPGARLAGLAALLAIAGCAMSARERSAPLQAVAQTQNVATHPDALPTPGITPQARRQQQPDDGADRSGVALTALPTPVLTSKLDADELIARAIAEHEMRRP
jgi:hypothetical protein